MNKNPDTAAGWQQLVTEATGCNNPKKLKTVQSLWSGFGSVFRVAADNQTLIIKHVNPVADSSHPRGWQSDFATQRKLKSYDIETHWYKHLSNQCHSNCRVAKYFGSRKDGMQHWLLIEDLDAAGYPLRYQSLNFQQATSCLDWLAHFHAVFMHANTDSLWQTGSYWHLATRPDEFEAMQDGLLKQNAQRIDQILNRCTHQTLIHGDAKVANFCFSKQHAVSAVDFQYIGGGCGMKDVAYFIGSCFSEDECSEFAEDLLDHYFATLESAISNTTEHSDTNELLQEWRALYPLAWTDFYRFLNGWMPTHKKIHRYTKLLAEQTFDSLSAF